jgi:hypothetical protein
MTTKPIKGTQPNKRALKHSKKSELPSSNQEESKKGISEQVKSYLLLGNEQKNEPV